jgi:hypothetical protein
VDAKRDSAPAAGPPTWSAFVTSRLDGEQCVTGTAMRRIHLHRIAAGRHDLMACFKSCFRYRRAHGLRQ